MAAEWEFGMGMELMPPSAAAAAAAAAPNYSSTTNNSPTYLYGLPSADTLRIDDLLDFSNHDVFSSSSASAAATSAHNFQLPQPNHHSSVNTGSSSYNLTSFPDDLYIPSEEAAELEWLSKFVEDSFSDVPYPSSTITTTNNSNHSNNNYFPTNTQPHVDPSSAAAPRQGARSKRSRASSFLANVSSNLRQHHHHHHHHSSSTSSTSSSSSSDFPGHHTTTTPTSSTSSKKKGGPSISADGTNLGVEGGVRRCTHCASEKTPQWRTGPLGPKTLCNACGVRYKSGRLVPEYRPAASPTFVLTQHSNSHRKVMELRRQKEQLHLIRHENPSAAAAAAAAAEMIYHDYEVC